MKTEQPKEIIVCYKDCVGIALALGAIAGACLGLILGWIIWS